MSDLRIRMVLEALDRITSPVRHMAQSYNSALSGMKRTTQDLSRSLTDAGKSMTDFGKSFSLKVSAPIAGFGTLAVRQAAMFEDYSASLETATGSVEAAQDAFKEMLDFTSTTPYQLDEVLDAFIKLKNLGLDPSREALTAYGNTASAMGKSLNQFIEAIADASTFEFERLKEFGIKANQSGNKVAFTFRGQTTVVRKNAQEIEAYLRRLGEVEFAGNMEKRMRNFNGILSNLKDTISTDLAAVGREIIENLDLKQFFRDLADAVHGLTTAFLKLPDPVQEFVVKGGLLLALLGPLIILIGQFTIGIGGILMGLAYVAPAFVAAAAAVKAFGIALLTTPVGWIMLAIAGLALAAWGFYKNWDKVRALFIGIWRSITSAVGEAKLKLQSIWAGMKADVASTVSGIMDLLTPVIKVLDQVRDGIGRVGNLATDNALTRTVSRMFGDEREAPPSGDLPSPLRTGTQRVDTGGTLHIKIDSEGRARVSELRTNDRRQDFSVETGLLMGAF